MSLRQLAGSEQVDPLQVLASVLEPVTFDERAHIQHANQLTPLNQLVDALPPDPPSRHDLEALVRAYLQNPTSQSQEAAELTTEFNAWVAAEPEILHLMGGSSTLGPAVSRAAELTELGIVGIEAISYLSSGVPADAGWKAEKLAVLDKAEKPEALVRFTVIRPLRDLVNAVPEAPGK